MNEKFGKILEAKRFYLRRFEVNEEDGQFIYELVNTPGWLEYIGNRHVNNMIDGKAYIENRLAKGYEDIGYGFFAMVDNIRHKCIGMAGIINREGYDFPDIGYAMMPEYYRRGYTSEAIQALLIYAKEVLIINRLIAIIDPSNDISKHLLTKNGFTEKEIRLKTENSESDILVLEKLL